MPLAQLQQVFLSALVTGDDNAARALVRSGNSDQARRLGVYRHNVRSNWRKALQASYPVVLALVGEPFFNEAADRLADAEPSCSGDLHRYGKGFADFLAAYTHARKLPYLPDVARLEWAWHESFHAAEHGALDFAGLAQVPPESHGALRFRLHPSARLVASAFPVLAIWSANQAGARDARVDLDSGGERVLVFRGDGETRLFPLTVQDWTFLASLAQGACLEETASHAAFAGEPSFLGEALKRWAETGVIVSFALAPESDS